MKLFDYPEAKQVIVSGDIHGDFRTLVALQVAMNEYIMEALMADTRYRSPPRLLPSLSRCRS